MLKDFSRDLGYLDKFLMGLRAHAQTLSEPAASRLATLLNEQDRAWGEIKGILAGTPVAETSNGGAQPAEAPASEASNPTAEAAPKSFEAAPRRLTVGSLMG